MPKQHADVVREAVEGNRSGSAETTVDVVLSVCDAAIEFRSRVSAVEGATYRGHDGIRRYFDDMADAWREWHNELEEVVELTPDTVLAGIRFYGVGRGSAIDVELRQTAVCLLSNDKLLQVHMHSSREEALQAVELSQ